MVASFLKEFDWSYRLYMDRKLYMALIKLQSEKRLTKSKSGLLSVVEGLHFMGYLSNEDYEVYKAKYSVGLDFEDLTPTQINQRETKANRDRQLNRHYKEVWEQWPSLKEKSKTHHLKKAEEDKHLIWARKVLEKGTQEKEL